MLDLVGILFSSIIMIMVVVRAIQMDTLQPWFKPPKTGTDSSGLRLRPDAPDGEVQGTRRNVTRGG
jgi:hypothetical protein